MLSRATRRATLAQIRHVAPVPPATAPPLVARVYAQVERDFGMLAPPMSLHAPAPEALAAAWLMLRETLLADGAADRAVKEAVATAVSRGNACPYCVDVHSATLHGFARGREAAAIAEDRIEDIADPGVRGVARWARHSGNRPAVSRTGLPFVPELAPELVGVAVTFHYLNRMVNVFLTDSPFPPGLPDGLRGTVTRVFGALLRPAARTRRAPGRALDLLPDAPLPADLVWAAGSPPVAQAFARATAAIDEAGRRSVPAAVRYLVESELDRWDGQPRGIGRSWTAELVSGLPAGERSAGRLALLTALASWQVGEGTVDEFRRDHPDDETLVGLASWASLAAARRIGSWIGTPRSSAVPTPDDR